MASSNLRVQTKNIYVKEKLFILNFGDILITYL